MRPKSQGQEEAYYPQDQAANQQTTDEPSTQCQDLLPEIENIRIDTLYRLKIKLEAALLRVILKADKL